MRPPLWKHQEEGIARALKVPDFAFFFEQGTGKTRTLIETIQEKFKCRAEKMLVFCPPIVISNWVREWKEFGGLTATSLSGSGAKRLKTFNANLAQGPRIFVTNYESLSMKPLFEAFQAWQPEVLVFDESHKLKSPKTARSKLAESLANPFDKKAKAWLPKPSTYLLSGTPVLNSPMDIFQQFLVMDGGEVFGCNFFAFRARYFRDRNAGMPSDRYFPDWQLASKGKDGFDAEAEITGKIFSKAMRVEKKDCLDLPPEVSITIPVPMSPVQSRLYEEMRKDLVTYFQSQACTASLAITKALRLLQITAGFVALEETSPLSTAPIRVEPLADCPKIQALEALLEEILANPKNKVLVWAVWQANYAQLRAVCEKLKVEFVEVHGGVSANDKRDAVDRFNNDAQCRVFIGHPGSGGIGINLVSAGYSIFYSRTFSLEQHLQARARNHRGGSKEAGHASIVHYDLVVQGTIDELAQKRLAQKQDMSEKLLLDMIAEI